MALFKNKDKIPPLEDIYAKIDRGIARDQAAELRGESIWGEKKKPFFTPAFWSTFWPTVIGGSIVGFIVINVLRCKGIL